MSCCLLKGLCEKGEAAEPFVSLPLKFSGAHFIETPMKSASLLVTIYLLLTLFAIMTAFGCASGRMTPEQKMRQSYYKEMLIDTDPEVVTSKRSDIKSELQLELEQETKDQKADSDDDLDSDLR